GFGALHVASSRDGNTHSSGARMYDEGTLEQVDSFLADFHVQSRIGVLQQDVLLCLYQAFCFQRLADSGLSQGINILPLLDTRSIWTARPLLHQSLIECFVRQQLKKTRLSN